MSTLPADAFEQASGLDNPVVALNLSDPGNFSTGMQFLDLMKMMKPWTAASADGKLGAQDLAGMGALDDQGWIKEIPEELGSIRTVWGWKDLPNGEERTGVYVLNYEGEGTLGLGGDARILSSEPGKITFEIMSGNSNWWVDLSSTDPNKTGDYIRDITIVAEKNLDLYEAGAVFNPQWLELIDDARQIRFMNWMNANNGSEVSWDEITKPGEANIGGGVSVEDMVRLANEIGADPWFCIPARASDEYIRNFATYVRDNLDPSLTVRVEYGNELWNYLFGSTRWLRDQSKEEWGDNYWLDYAAKNAVNTALIWEDVFGEQGEDRLINVLGAQAVNPWVAKRLLEARIWEKNDPDNFVEPASVFEELAITTYFGNKTVNNEARRAELLEAIKDPNVDAEAYLAEKLMDPEYNGSIPWYQERWQANADLAHQYGLDLVAYEGGQHIHEPLKKMGADPADLELLTEFLSGFVRSEAMAYLYEQAAKVWAEVGDGPLMQFQDIGKASKFGSWGLYTSLTDSSPRSDALNEINETMTPWWDGATAGDQYLQGITVTGTEDDEILFGTQQEDYLIAGGGDDTLIAGPGNDGLNGGDGLDRAVFAGRAADYSLAVKGAGYLISGPDGTDYLVNIEELQFEDGTVYSPEEFLELGPVKPALTPEPLPEPAPEPAPEPLPEPAPEPDPGTEGSVDETNASPQSLTEADDTYAGTAQDNLILAGDGADTLTGDRGDDVFYGGAGNDRLWGGKGDDTLFGDDGDDYLHAGPGNDDLSGGAGQDRLIGGAGNDDLSGGAGDDNISAGAGNDIVSGDDGADRLVGGAGNDRMFGGADDDFLLGGRGDDLLWGGAGNDRFRFSAGSGQDRIEDFEEGDMLQFKNFFDGSGPQAYETNGELVLSNGTDSITFANHGLDDLSWIAADLADSFHLIG